MKVDDILTVERIAIQQRVQGVLQTWLDRQEPCGRIGVHVVSVSLDDVKPPQEVAEAFRDVTAARADAQRAINEGLKAMPTCCTSRSAARSSRSPRKRPATPWRRPSGPAARPSALRRWPRSW